MHGEGRASDGLHCSCDRATSTFGTRRLVPRRTSTVLGKRVASVAREVCPECVCLSFLELFEQGRGVPVEWNQWIKLELLSST